MTRVMRFGDTFLYKNDLPDDFHVDGDIAIDTEAMGLNNLRDRLCLVQFSVGDGVAHLVNFEPDRFEAPNLKKLLTDPKRVKIFHFARFDLAIIHYYLGIGLENVYCTKIASRLARTYTDAHSLKELCGELLGIKLNKLQQSSDWGNAKLTPPQLEYAANDVLHLHKLRDRLSAMLEREGRSGLAKRCFDFLPTRAELDIAGWPEVDIFSHSL